MAMMFDSLYELRKSGKKKAITIPASNVSGSVNLTGFPALVRLGADADIVAALGNGDGSDIFFTNNNGEQIPHELVQSGNFATYSGGYTWFCYPEAVYSASQDKTYIGWINAQGEYGIACYDHANDAWTFGSWTAAWGLIEDDHNNPVIYVRSDGKILVAYCAHGDATTCEIRISTNAGDVTSWGAASTITMNGGSQATYSQLHYLATGGRLCLINRNGTSYQLTISTDEGNTWGTPVTFFNPSSEGENGYVITRSDGTDRIDAVFTDSHPVNGGQQVFHAYYLGSTNTWYTTDGSALTVDFAPSDLNAVSQSRVYTATGTDTAWISDVHYDGTNIHVLFYRYQGDKDYHVTHHLYYAKYASGAWTTVKVCDESMSPNRYGVGRETTERQYPAVGQFYDGDPTQLLTAVLDENEDYQITRFYTSDSGASWTKGAQLTNGRGFDSFRPRVVKDQANDTLQWIWMGNGQYVYFSNESSQKWNTAIRVYPGAHKPYEFAWVRADLSPNVDTVLNVHYGSGTKANNDPTEVWKDYEFVWHGSLGINDSNQDWIDSTGTRQGIIQRNALTPQTYSKIPGCLFKTPYTLGASLPLGDIVLENETDFHAEALVYWTASGASPHTIIDDQKTGASAGTACYAKLALAPADSSVDGQVLQEADTAWPATPSASAIASQNSLHQIYFGFSSTDATSRTRVDGTEYTTTESTGALDRSLNTNSLQIGTNYDPDGNSYTNDYNGWLSEVRIGLNQRTEAWTDTQWTNVSDVDGFVTFGSEETDTTTLAVSSGPATTQMGSGGNLRVTSTALVADVEKARIASSVVGPQVRADAKRVTRLGINAARANTRDDVTAIGYCSLLDSLGRDTIGVGSNAGRNAQGNEGVFLGVNAGANHRGAYGCFVGFAAGFNADSNYTTYIGHKAGYACQGVGLTMVGASAGYLGNCSTSVGVGYEALSGAVSASSTAIGYQCGKNTAASAVTLVGYVAGQGNTQSSVVFVGAESGLSNTGQLSTGVGRQALYQNTGNHSTAVGYQAGYQNAYLGTTAVGYLSGFGVLKNYTSFLGHLSGYQCNSVYAVGIGYQACRQDSGSTTVGIGREAAYLNSGFNVTAIGDNAGRTNSAHYGTFIGTNAGSANSTAQRCQITDGLNTVFNSVTKNVELFGHLTMPQVSAPSDPASGKYVIYMDSTTGDLMVKINFGGTVKTATLADFSAL